MNNITDKIKISRMVHDIEPLFRVAIIQSAMTGNSNITINANSATKIHRDLIIMKKYIDDSIKEQDAILFS
jgi:hypothetical protein